MPKTKAELRAETRRLLEQEKVVGGVRPARFIGDASGLAFDGPSDKPRTDAKQGLDFDAWMAEAGKLALTGLKAGYADEAAASDAYIARRDHFKPPMHLYDEQTRTDFADHADGLPDQPRDEHGRYAESGGSGGGSGVGFASPYDKDTSQSFGDAVHASASAEHGQAIARCEAIDKARGLDAHTEATVGDTKEWGTENSVLTRFNGASFEQIRQSMAEKGLAMNQKAVIPFVFDHKGPDTLYTVPIPRAWNPTNLASVRAKLDEHGLDYRTFAHASGNIAVMVYDQGSKLEENIGHLADHYGVADKDVDVHNGHGEFLGGETREAGAAAYREVLGKK